MANEAPFVCDECGRSFKRKSDLTRHKKIHMSDAPLHYCDILPGCTYSTRQKYNLETHYQTKSHLNLKPHSCGHGCSDGHFANGGSLIRHEKSRHGRIKGKPYFRPTAPKRPATSEQEGVNTFTHPSIRLDTSPFEFIPPLQSDSSDKGFETPAYDQGNEVNQLLDPAPLTPGSEINPSTPSLCDSSDLRSMFAPSPFPATPFTPFAPSPGHFGTVGLSPEWLAHQAASVAADQFFREQFPELIPAPEFIQGSSSSSTTREQLALANADYMTGTYAPEYPEVVAQWDQDFWSSIPRDTQEGAEGPKSFNESSGASSGTDSSVFDTESWF